MLIVSLQFVYALLSNLNIIGRKTINPTHIGGGLIPPPCKKLQVQLQILNDPYESYFVDFSQGVKPDKMRDILAKIGCLSHQYLIFKHRNKFLFIKNFE